MNEEPGPVEILSNVVTAFNSAVLFFTAFAVGVAFLVWGNTLARLVGAGLLAVWLYFALRFARKRFAN